MASDGTVYVGSNGAIDRIAPNGRASRVAGIANLGFYGDGGPAISADLGRVTALMVHPDGSVTFADWMSVEGGAIYRVRRVTPDGRIATIAGGAPSIDALIPDGTPAFGAPLTVRWMTSGPGDVLYVGGFTGVVYKVLPRFGGSSDAAIRIPSDTGAELYEFDAAGRHLQTRNALSGAATYTFTYNPDGQLSAIVDGDGLETRIERDGSAPTAIVAPFAQRTTLEVDGQGYLASVTAPGGRTTRLTSTPTGLLTELEDANGHVHTFEHDALGRLSVDADPAGGSQALARTELAHGWQVARTTALGRTWTYETEDLTDGSRLLTNTAADGTQTTQLVRKRSTNTVSMDKRWVAA